MRCLLDTAILHHEKLRRYIRSIWDGGCSYKESNEVLLTLTIKEIDILLNWLRNSAFDRKYQQDSLPGLISHLQRLKSLEESRISVPEKEAELHRLRQMLRS